jgi:hypothetical protein
MTQRRTLRALIACGCLTYASVGRADVVTDWNLITQPFAATRPQGPSGLFDIAMVHAAMHDAIQAFDGRFEPYSAPIPNAAGSPIAAAAAAAHGVLVGLFPAQQAALDITFQNYLIAQGLQGDPGVAVGEQAALNILTQRMNDGRFPANSEDFVGGTEPGEWRSELPTPLPMITPWVGNVVPFTLKDPAQLLAPPPPHLTSGAYAKAYNEVKELGALDSTARTPEQTDIAYFFADNSIQYWNRLLRTIAETHLSDIGDSARLFALVNLAMADAGISAWYNKKYWNLWRPITAIHEGDNDGNARTEGDADWVPFITTPNYPEYTSGSNSLSGAASRMLKHFFGTDKMELSLTSGNAQAVNPRSYSRFSEIADDIVDARIYQGIHFRFGDRSRDGRPLKWPIGPSVTSCDRLVNNAIAHE